METFSYVQHPAAGKELARSRFAIRYTVAAGTWLMRAISFSVVGLLSAVLAASGPLHAQLPPQLVAGLSPKQRLRVQMTGGAKAEGRLLEVGREFLHLRIIDRSHARARFDTLAIPIDSITGLWTHAGTYAPLGAAVGAAFGAVTVAGLAVTFCSDPDSGGCNVGSIVAGSALSGAIFAGLGALITGGINRWQPLYVPDP